MGYTQGMWSVPGYHELKNASKMTSVWSKVLTLSWRYQAPYMFFQLTRQQYNSFWSPVSLRTPQHQHCQHIYRCYQLLTHWCGRWVSSQQYLACSQNMSYCWCYTLIAIKLYYSCDPLKSVRTMGATLHRFAAHRFPLCGFWEKSVKKAKEIFFFAAEGISCGS